MTREWSRREALGFGAVAAASLGARAQSTLPSGSLAPKRLASAPPHFDPSVLDALIEALLPRSRTPGLSLAVIRGGQVVYARGYGVANAATGRPVTPDTIFQAASLTKPLFAYLVLKLCERGDMALDTPLAKYAPATHVSRDPRAERITARNILTHTSGLPNWTNGRRPLQLRFAPGESFGYSSEGYVYLQEAVERALDTPLKNLMEDRVIGPLDLNESGIVWLPEYESTAAVGYEWDGTPVKYTSKPTEAGGASTLHTTAADYAKFMCELIEYRQPDAYRLDYVSERMMTSPQVRVNGGLAWGLGWGLHLQDDGDRFWHWGDSRGFMSFAVGSRPARSGVVLFTNGRHGLRLADRVAEAVMGDLDPVVSWLYDVFYEGELPEWPEADPAPPRLSPEAPRGQHRKGGRS